MFSQRAHLYCRSVSLEVCISLGALSRHARMSWTALHSERIDNKLKELLSLFQIFVLPVDISFSRWRQRSFHPRKNPTPAFHASFVLSCVLFHYLSFPQITHIPPFSSWFHYYIKATFLCTSSALRFIVVWFLTPSPCWANLRQLKNISCLRFS